MPNWCNNNIRLRHDNPEKLEEIVQIIKKNEEDNDGYGLFTHLVPPPNSAAYKDEGNQDDYREDPEFWYNWNVANWGTKWEPKIDYCGYTSKEKNEIEFDFDTAWAPPYQIFEALNQQGYSVDAAYMECGMDYWGNYIDGDDEIGGEMKDYLVDDQGHTYTEWKFLNKFKEIYREQKQARVLVKATNKTRAHYRPPEEGVGSALHAWERMDDILDEMGGEISRAEVIQLIRNFGDEDTGFDALENLNKDWDWNDTVSQEKSKERALSIGIDEETWIRCDLGNIRGG